MNRLFLSRGVFHKTLSSVTIDSFCYKLLKYLASDWSSADLSLIFVIFHMKKGFVKRVPGLCQGHLEQGIGTDHDDGC